MNKTVLLKIFLFLFNVSGVVFILILKRKRRLIKLWRFSVIIFCLAFFSQVIVYIDAKYVEPNWIQVKRLTIKNKIFPDGLSGLKIVQISDLHIEKFGFREESLIKKVNALSPDLVLITGDFVNGKEGLPVMLAVLSRLNSAKGIYGVLGDNDDTVGLKEALRKINIRILNNENIRIPVNNGKSLWLIGLSNAPIGIETFNLAYYKVNLAEPKILLSHSQQVMDSGFINTANTDLVLTGDTHGTQMGIAFIRKLSSYVKGYKYISGLYYVNGVPLYVNNGIGVQERKIRFLCRPEITLIKLE